VSSKEDYINIALMIFSCGLAFVLPFELFLFSYAVLGPLHYLTEISWLHQRNYFATGKRDYTVLILLCLLISLGVIFHDVFVMRKYFEGFFQPDTLKLIMKTYSKWFPVLIFTAFIGALGLIAFKKISYKLIMFGIGLLVGYLLRDTKFNMVFVAIFVPTLIHVYVFTGLFMLYGAMKSRSTAGYVSVLVFVGVALSFYFIQYVPEGFSVSRHIKEVIVKSGFSAINVASIGFFKSGEITAFDVFDSRRGLMVQRFIAFAYTYHYLNWFSKTEIIKWHLVPKKWLIGSVLVWLASVALYIYDFRTGLVVLFFMSLLHVFLEFPLNFRSILGIFEEGKSKLFSKKPIKAASK
jgi:hypothetical protein